MMIKTNKNDEYYTHLKDIERELQHYNDHFKGKTIYCNCDDPLRSNFFHYFAYNFHHHSVKRLISTCYRSNDGDAFSDHNSDNGTYLDYHGEYKNEKSIPDLAQVYKQQMHGDGDFRSLECINFLKQADIVITNPPYSIFREYIQQLIDYKKKFIVVGPLNAIGYKEIHPLLRSKEIHIGNYMVTKFNRPDNKIGYSPSVWFTNLSYKSISESNPYTANEDIADYNGLVAKLFAFC